MRSHDRWVVWPAVASTLAMLVWMARGLVTGQVPFTGDLLHFHYPLRDFYASALSRGQSFDWMPSLYGGFYVVGEGQLGAYHPAHWLLYRWLPLDAAFTTELVLAYPLLFVGMWRWLSGWVGRGPAAFGALTTTFCGFMLVHGVHPNVVGVLAHVPWLLRAVDDLAHGATVRGALGTTATMALLIGSQILLGHPQSVWFSLLITVAYGGFLAWDAQASQQRSMAAWLVTSMVAAVVLGALVGALQLLATLDALRHSTRPAYDVTFATLFSLSWSQVWQVMHPYLQWGRVARWNEVPGAGDEYGVYGSGVVLLLAVWWAARAAGGPLNEEGRRVWRFGWATLAFGGLGVWLALGRDGGLYLVQTWLPLANQFRAPVRYTLFTQWALAVVAALALRDLRGRAANSGVTALASGRRALALVWLAVGVVTVSAAWLARSARADGGAALLAVWWGPVVVAIAALLITAAAQGARGSRSAVAALLLLTAGDLAVYGLGIPAWQDLVTRPQAEAYLDSNSFLPQPGPGRLARGGFPNLFALAGHRLLDGYLGITPTRQLDYRQPQALRVAQVDFVHGDALAGAVLPNAQALDRGWFALPPSLSRARLVSEVMVSASPAVDIARIDVERVALVAREVSLQQGPPGRAQITVDEPGRVHIDVATDSRQLLVLSESFDEGWRVSVEGAPVVVERVNGDFVGTVVPSGMHGVEFVFAPRHLAIGRMVSAAATLTALGLLAWARQKGRV